MQKLNVCTVALALEGISGQGQEDCGMRVIIVSIRVWVINMFSMLECDRQTRLGAFFSRLGAGKVIGVKLDQLIRVLELLDCSCCGQRMINIDKCA